MGGGGGRRHLGLWLAIGAGITAAVLAAQRPRAPELGACRSVPVPTDRVNVPAAVPPVAVPRGAQAALVERVVDGDGLCVLPTGPGPLPAGGIHEIRVLGINAPGKDRCWNEEATAYAGSTIGEGAVVFLLADEQDRDAFGRSLRWVWDGKGAFFSERAVAAGQARVLHKRPNDRYIDRLWEAEDRARKAGLGLWKACFPEKLLRWLP